MEKSVKKAKAREEFRIFTEQLLERSFGDLTEKQRTYALVHFYVSEIYSKLRNEISKEDIDDGYVDNANDLDIDFIWKDSGHVLIIQSRYHGDGVKEKPKDIQYFQDLFLRLFSEGFNPNAKLKDILASIDWQNDTFELIYLTFGSIDGQAQDQTKIVPVCPTQYVTLPERCEWEFFDESGINQELRRANSISNQVDSEWTEFHSIGNSGKRAPVIEIPSDELRSCVAVVAAKQLVQIYQHHQDALFTLNIRNFIGNTRHNQAIIRTARADPAHFFYFNNGVSCLARELRIENSVVRARGLQIINGAQTVRSLVRASTNEKNESAWPDKSKQPLVLVRITEVGENYGQSGKFREEITTYNNTQNVIKQSDFRSNDAIQKDLVKKFATYKRLGKSVVYVPKRTDRRPPNSFVIRLEDFSKTTFSFLRDPVSFSGSTAYLFDESETGGYKYVFGDGKDIWELMPEDEFRLRSAIWWLSEAFSEQVGADRKVEADSVTRAALERKWMYIFAARVVLQRVFGNEDYKTILMKFYRGDWEIGKAELGAWFKNLYEISKSSVLFVYKQASKDPGFVHRNWMRSAKTPQAIADFVFANPLLSLSKPPKN